MPKQNFRQAKIYAIKSHKTDKVYIGSTTERLISNRMKGHRSNYKRYLKGKGRYVTSYEILEYGDAYIELIKNCPCDDINELRAFEGAEIRATNCVNKVVPGRTQKEWCEDNKLWLQVYEKARYQANKGKFVCYECEYRCSKKNNLTRHNKSKRHLEMVEFLIGLFGPNYNDAE